MGGATTRQAGDQGVQGDLARRHSLELGRPKGTAGRIALPVAGDDKAAKAIVLKLVDELGFDGVDARGWPESWRNSPAHQSMSRISTPRVCDVLYPRPKGTYSGMAGHRE